MSRRMLDGIVEQLDSVVRTAVAPLQDEIVNLRKQVTQLRKELTATHMQWHQDMKDNNMKLQRVAGTPQVATPQPLGSHVSRQQSNSHPHQPTQGQHPGRAAQATPQLDNQVSLQYQLAAQGTPAGALASPSRQGRGGHVNQGRELPPWAVDQEKQPAAPPPASYQNGGLRNLPEGVPFSEEPEVPWQGPPRRGRSRQQNQGQPQRRPGIPPDIIARWRDRLGGKVSEAWTGLSRAFRAFDWNGDGVIDAGEFEKLLLRWHLPQEDIHQLFRCIDRDSNGGIDYREFQSEFGAAICGDKAFVEGLMT